MADLPPWKPLSGVTPPSTDGAGRVVALVATEEAAQSGWAPSTALDLARSWTEQGRRVILVDGALAAPSLHGAAGVSNREGLVDAALHGASVAHVSHPLEGGAFFLVTAGTPVASAWSVVRSGRWHRIAEGITEAGVLLLLYLRDGNEGTPAFLGSASDIVVLAGPEDRPPATVSDLAPLVRAVTGPEDARAAPAPAPASEPAPAPESAPASEMRRASPAAPKVFEKEEKGMGRLVLLILIAIVAAAGLGYLLTSLS